MEPISDTGTRTGIPLIRRHFTTAGEDPFAQVEWTTMDAWPDNPAYHVPNIRNPKFWTQNQLNIVSKLYLSKSLETPETDIQKLFERVASQIALKGLSKWYFGEGKLWAENNTEDARVERLAKIREHHPDHPAVVFYDELCFLLLHGYGAFNSPVWFNVGRSDRDQQVSACFILGAEDSTESLSENSVREIKIFRGGSGSGKNMGAVRGSREALSGGGTASGPVSFMRADDAWAGTIKSGGKTRRAAKLVALDVDHPDILDFVDCKVREEERLRILASAGMNIGFDEEGERNVAEVTSFQNANNSVAVTREFMRLATEEGGEELNWALNNRGEEPGQDFVNASTLLEKISKAAHAAACPGLLFIDTMNDMHTTPVIDGKPSPIRSTNPCGEYVSNDDTSCNLASLNVKKFLDGDGELKIEDFRQAVDVFITAMDILVAFAYYPDEKIAQNSRAMRQLGLGYANMGAAIMSKGLAYGSPEARSWAASVTSLMTGRAYRQSAILAREIAPFKHFEENREAMLKVVSIHRESAKDISESSDAAWEGWTDWNAAIEMAEKFGFRNAQTTVLAPTGTISFLMACDTTGVEPAFELVQYKSLAGGGSMVLVNESVAQGLVALGYHKITPETVESICRDLQEHGVEQFMEAIAEDDRPVFYGANDIPWKDHIDMMAAVQPFLSGAISKTINMPHEATDSDVLEAYVYAWRQGVKDIAVYRDGSKARQVLGGRKSGASGAADPWDFLRELLLDEGLVLEEYQEDLVRDLYHAKVLPGDAEEMNPDNIILPLTQVQSDVDIQAAALKIAESWRRGESRAFPTSEEVEQTLKRRRMPRTGEAVRHKIHIKSSLGENEGYILVGKYEDGSPGEIFLEGFGKHGGFTQNAMSVAATMISIMLQYGIPLEVIVRKIAWVADETGGMVVPGDEAPVITNARSIVDYIARWLIGTFGTIDQAEEYAVMTPEVKARKTAQLDAQAARIGFDPGIGTDVTAGFTDNGDGTYDVDQVINGRQGPPDRLMANGNGAAVATPVRAGDGPPCNTCGNRMQRTGACYTCPGCGSTTGCG